MEIYVDQVFIQYMAEQPTAESKYDLTSKRISFLEIMTGSLEKAFGMKRMNCR